VKVAVVQNSVPTHASASPHPAAVSFSYLFCGEDKYLPPSEASENPMKILEKCMVVLYIIKLYIDLIGSIG